MPGYPGNIFWGRGNAFTLKAHNYQQQKEAAASHISWGESHSVFREVDLFGHVQYLRPPAFRCQGGLTSILKLVPGME